jgi:imidazolonepropionase
VALLIRGARQLLTLQGPAGARRGAAMRDLAIIADGAVLVREGVIAEVGPARRLENLKHARSAEEINATGRVVMPGFVDSHTHLIFAGLAVEDYESRIAGGEAHRAEPAPETVIRPTHTAARLSHRARQRLQRIVCHGTTTIEVKSGYGPDETGELKALRAARWLPDELATVLPTFLAGKIVPTNCRGETARYFEYLCAELLPKIKRRKLARHADLVCDTAAFSMIDMRRYLTHARSLGFPVKVHAERSASAEAVELAIASDALSVDHLEDAGPESIAALGGAAVIATLLPGAGFHPGGPARPPARALIDGGAAVALATNFSPESSPTYSMQFVLSLACSQLGMTPAEAITAATINSAYAVAWADRAGSIQIGKDADLLIMNVADYREIPYVFGVNHVHKAIKRGEVIYDEESAAEHR